MKKTSLGLALLVALGTVGCVGAPAEDPGSEALVLRSYAAPGRAQELADALNQLMDFGDSENDVGRARVAPGDQVLVLAPASVHEGLAEVIAARLEGRGEGHPAEVAMSYWFVAARPIPGEPRYGKGLDEVRSVLQDLVTVEGPQEFTLYEHVVLRQASGYRSDVKSPRAHIYQTASVSGRDVIVDLIAELPSSRNRFRTVLTLQDGQILVLGQSGLNARDFDRSFQGGTLYTIVRAHAPSSP